MLLLDCSGWNTVPRKELDPSHIPFRLHRPLPKDDALWERKVANRDLLIARSAVGIMITLLIWRQKLIVETKVAVPHKPC